MARSREQAAELVAAGRVTVGGVPAQKPASAVGVDAPVLVASLERQPAYASRAGAKLAHALSVFGASSPALAVVGRRALDAGASTGGFTGVLLTAGVSSVFAVDVGYGQLAWSLRTDPRVTVLDRTNVRHLQPHDVGGLLPDLVVADLSFISLRLVLPALRRCATPDADFVLLVKPQFEVGRGRLPAGGVVRDAQDRADAVRGVAATAAELGLGVAGVTASPLRGAAGNVEILLWLRVGAAPLQAAEVDRALGAGPS